jgi:hypothetical protein
MDRCPGALSSFTRVNVFLLQVYWEKSVWTSCKRLIFAETPRHMIVEEGGQSTRTKNVAPFGL